jgi:threonine synthase
MWKAFHELRELGWLRNDKLPRMIACQSDGCAPLVRAFAAGARFAEPFPDPCTAASGLRVPTAVGDFMILDAIRQSGGWAMTGREANLLPWMQRVTRAEGIAICPETAICFDCLDQLRQAGKIGEHEKVVVFNTGAANKYPEVMRLALPRLDCRNSLDYGAILGC